MAQTKILVRNNLLRPMALGRMTINSRKRVNLSDYYTQEEIEAISDILLRKKPKMANPAPDIFRMKEMGRIRIFHFVPGKVKKGEKEVLITADSPKVDLEPIEKEEVKKEEVKMGVELDELPSVPKVKPKTMVETPLSDKDEQFAILSEMRLIILENKDLTKTKMPVLGILNERLEKKGIAPVSAYRRNYLFHNKLEKKVDKIQKADKIEDK